MFPILITEIRHGEAEGNKAGTMAKNKDASAYKIPGFAERAGHNWRLTDRGIQQAKAAGKWMNENFPRDLPPRVYLSPYLRPRETYVEMEWEGEHELYEDVNLRERSWGELDSLSPQERLEKFEKIMAKKDVDPMYWKTPNGESIIELCMRRTLFHGTLHRFHDKYPDRPVVLMGHGENMWTGRHLFWRNTVEEYNLLDLSDNPHDRCHNCQIWQYSRLDPFTQEVHADLTWFRSICPWDTNLSSNEWQRIIRKPLTKEDLMRQVNAIKRLIN